MVLNTYICMHGRSVTIYRICVCMISLVVFYCIKAMNDNNKQCWLKHSSSQMHVYRPTVNISWRENKSCHSQSADLHMWSTTIQAPAFGLQEWMWKRRERTDLLQGLDLGVELVQLLLPILQVSQQVLIKVLQLHVALTHLWGLRQPASFAHYKRTQSITMIILGQI